MTATIESQQSVVIKFAGDSGDGMQLTGNQFTDASALAGNDLATFPDYPAEIRAPQGTLAGVSGFQLHFSSKPVYTPGDQFDVLVAMNAAALKTNIQRLKKNGTIIVNTAGFDSKNLRLSGYVENPLEDGSLEHYRLISMDVTKLTRETLKETTLGTKEKDRSKNMFVLGFLFWMYDRKLDTTLDFLSKKFKQRPDILTANKMVLQAGYNYGDTTETFTSRYRVKAAQLPAGRYRNVMGNQATVYGMIAASQKSGLGLFLGSYPITPASDILHMLSNYKHFGVKTFQAEDEIASITAAIGAAFGGQLAATSTSGPGMALKTEALGLAIMLEIPLLVLNIQRAGPSTGLPTKTEQADLLQAVYGRNGEAPLPVIAPQSPADCFDVVFEAIRIALEHMTPVVFLSDGYIANGAEPWRYPAAADLPKIQVEFAAADTSGAQHLPYVRDNRLVRPWAIPGTKGLEHRLGGLEKEDGTGNVSYDPDNHEKMVKIRAEKIQRIADYIPLQSVDQGPESGKVLVLGWGSTYGAIRSAVSDLHEAGHSSVSHAHLRYLFPFPKNLGSLLQQFDHIIVPEINNGQLIKLLRDQYLVPAIPLNKIKGTPFTRTEIKEALLPYLTAE